MSNNVWIFIKLIFILQKRKDTSEMLPLQLKIYERIPIPDLLVSP
jgi:hypothetical protein